jgi:shikimate kinase
MTSKRDKVIHPVAFSMHMQTRSWILVGMMGAGKSSVGRELARISERTFADTDQLLQNRFGRPVGKIFDTYGEATFRDHESSILRALEPGPFVVATGGGIVVREENWQELHRLGTTIFLRVSVEQLIERLTVSRKRRPLLEVENWQDRLRDLYDQRMPLYEKAMVTFDVSIDNSAIVAEHLLSRLLEVA